MSPPRKEDEQISQILQYTRLNQKKFTSQIAQELGVYQQQFKSQLSNLKHRLFSKQHTQKLRVGHHIEKLINDEDVQPPLQQDQAQLLQERAHQSNQVFIGKMNQPQTQIAPVKTVGGSFKNSRFMEKQIKSTFDHYGKEKKKDMGKLEHISLTVTQGQKLLSDLKKDEFHHTIFTTFTNGGNQTYAFSQYMSHFKDQIKLTQGYIENKLKEVLEQRRLRQQALEAQKELEKKIKEQQKFADDNDPTKMNIFSGSHVFHKAEDYKALQQQKMKEIVKQEIARGIIEKALKEMRQQHKEIIKKGILGLCLKIYFQSGKTIHEFNVMQRELYNPTPELKNKNVNNEDQDDNQIAELELGLKNMLMQTGVNGKYMSQGIKGSNFLQFQNNGGVQKSSTFKKKGNHQPQISISSIKDTAPTVVFKSSNGKTVLFGHDDTTKKKAAVKRSGLVGVSQIMDQSQTNLPRKSRGVVEQEYHTKLRDYSNHFKDIQHKYALLIKGGLTENATKNDLIEEEIKETPVQKEERLRQQREEEVLKKERFMYKIQRGKQAPTKEDIEIERKSLELQKTKTVGEEEDILTQRFKYELAFTDEERNGLHSLMDDPYGKLKAFQKRVNELKAKQDEAQFRKMAKESKVTKKDEKVGLVIQVGGSPRKANKKRRQGVRMDQDNPV